VKRLCGAIVHVCCVPFLMAVIYLEIATVATRVYMRNGYAERFSDLPLRSSKWFWPDPPRFTQSCFGLCTREELP
jgi:hypothetical protein